MPRSMTNQQSHTRSKCALPIPFLILFLVSTSSPLLYAQEAPALLAKVKDITGGVNGQVGITIRHIESGQGIAINGDQLFPTASVYKVPIMVEVLRQVTSGNISLSDRVTLQPEKLYWSTTLSHFDAGLNPTIHDLVFWMITQSENGATDILLEKIGAENVTATMRKLGLEHINVNRLVKYMMCDYMGIYDLESRSLTGDEFRKMWDRRAAATYSQLWGDKNAPIPKSVRKFDREPKDVASPNDVTSLMEMIFKKKVINEQMSQMMTDILLQTTFWPNLLPAQLPPNTPVARKAGTLPTTLNETGIIYLPDDAGHVIVTVMTNDLRGNVDDDAKVIAQVARAAYDYFLMANAHSEGSKREEVVTAPARTVKAWQTAIMTVGSTECFRYRSVSERGTSLSRGGYETDLPFLGDSAPVNAAIPK